MLFCSLPCATVGGYLPQTWKLEKHGEPGSDEGLS